MGFKQKLQSISKKNKIAISLISILFLAGTIAAVILSVKVDKPIYINSARALNNIKNNLSGHYILNQQTFVSDEPIVPIGTKEHPFTGTLECTNANKTMSSICSMSFDSNYIRSQFEDSNSNEVNIGLFAYNSGVVRGIFFWDIRLPDLSSYVDSNKTINFGVIAAHNDGWINKCCVDTFSGSIDGKHVNLGTIAGVNTGEIKIGQRGAGIKTNIYGSSNIGGVVGLNKPALTEGNNKPKSYIWATTGGNQNVYCHKKDQDNYDINYGGICGYMEGGEIKDCSGGSLTLNIDKDVSPNIYSGGLVGTIDSNNVSLNYCFDSYSINRKDKGYFSSAIGRIKDNSIVNTNSLIFKPVVSLSNTDAYFGTLYGVKGNNVTINSNNKNSYYDASISCTNVNYDKTSNISFTDVNLNSFGYDSDIWEKDESKKILKVKVKIWQ